ncbi:MAG: MaoC family dehydratase [Pseudomonadota bacterium]
MKTISPAGLQDHIGRKIGTSEWIVVDQKRINTFADVTEDWQFIHLDEEKAKQTPFGGTIAHGFLTLSLLPRMAEAATLVLEGCEMGINYGFEKIRFLQPVPSGARVRGHFTLKGAQAKTATQYLITYAIEVEIEGADKPALIAEWLAMQVVAG